jgi:AraC-like DNA-binding protein
MQKIDPEYRLMRFSTDAIEAPARLDVWRDLITRKLFRLSIDTLSETPYRAKAALRALPSLKIGLGAFSAAIHHRTAEIAAAENDDVVLLVNLAGSVLVRRAGGESLVGEGEGLLVACNEPGVYIMAEPGRHLVVRLTPGVLGAFAGRIGPSLGRVIPASTESLKLLVDYSRALPRGDWELSPAATQVVSDHIGDLIGLIVGASGDAAALAQRRGVAAARLGAAKAHIRERIGQFDLTEHAIAAEQGISPRYLRQLFEAEDQSFTGYVLEQRLSQAYAMITSRRLASEAISKIAFEVGFGDISYFNRAFRRRFERTPTDVRTEAIRRWRQEDTEAGRT